MNTIDTKKNNSVYNQVKNNAAFIATTGTICAAFQTGKELSGVIKQSNHKLSLKLMADSFKKELPENAGLLKKGINNFSSKLKFINATSFLKNAAIYTAEGLAIIGLATGIMNLIAKKKD